MHTTTQNNNNSMSEQYETPNMPNPDASQPNPGSRPADAPNLRTKYRDLQERYVQALLCIGMRLARTAQPALQTPLTGKRDACIERLSNELAMTQQSLRNCQAMLHEQTVPATSPQSTVVATPVINQRSPLCELQSKSPASPMVDPVKSMMMRQAMGDSALQLAAGCPQSVSSQTFTPSTMEPLEYMPTDSTHHPWML